MPDTARMTELAAMLESHEIGTGLEFVRLMHRNGSMDDTEARDWTRRTLARREFLGIGRT
jgi:hypothetical protein